MRILYKGNTVNLPDFLIVGAAKSATTSIHYYLKNSPSIYLPKVKESYFFTFRNKDVNYKSSDNLPEKISKESEYFDFFSAAKTNQIIGDASPSYLYDFENTIRNIKDVYGKHYEQLKIIIILRNPMDRAYSQYMMFRRGYNENMGFKEATEEATIKDRLNAGWNIFYDYLGFGNYYSQVEAYLKSFKHIKIYLYDDFVNHEQEIMNDIADFLTIKRFTLSKKEIYNVSGTPKNILLHKFLYKPNVIKKIFKYFLSKSTRTKLKLKLTRRNMEKSAMSAEDRNRLIVYYENNINLLSKLIGKDLTNWTRH